MIPIGGCFGGSPLPPSGAPSSHQRYCRYHTTEKSQGHENGARQLCSEAAAASEVNSVH